MRLGRFPRIRLGHLPTPLEPMPRLSEFLGGPTLFVKRDDCTGLATGGNKTRKLEFLMADAQLAKADTILTHGAVQSNHARQSAAAAAKLGMGCELLLESRVVEADETYKRSGNVLLDQLFGATLRVCAAGTDMDTALREAAEAVRDRGGRPYVIPGGGSNAIGAVGYVNCALEIVGQANDMGVPIDYVVHATGSAGTQAGLVAGFQGCSSGIRVLGIGVRAAKNAQAAAVLRLAEATADRVGVRGGVPRDAVVANCDYVGKGYGVPTPAMVEALRLVARYESILLDPVYSGKAMAGLIDLIRKGTFQKSDNVVFLHTGGSAAIFAYLNALTEEA